MARPGTRPARDILYREDAALKAGEVVAAGAGADEVAGEEGSGVLECTGETAGAGEVGTGAGELGSGAGELGSGAGELGSGAGALGSGVAVG